MLSHEDQKGEEATAPPQFPLRGGEMGSLIRSFDWSTTPIGPVERWSPTLRVMVSFLLANRFPLLLWWGPNYISIYNDAYRPILGTKHPWALGRPVSEVWSEIWSVLKPLIDTPFEGGEATWMEDIELYVNRHGFLEESHFTVAYSPVPDDTAAHGIGGVLATVHEITEKVISERRVAVLRDLGSRASQATSAEEACAIAAAALSNHSKDVPFALLYLIDHQANQARLAGMTGVAPGASMSPLRIPIDSSDAPWPIAELLKRQKIVLVDDLAGRFIGLPLGPWNDPPQSAVLVPLQSTRLGELAGFLIAGVSSRLQLDHFYRSFFDLMAAQIATSIAHAVAYEEERKRAEALAEIDRAKTAFFSNVSHEFRTPLTLMLGPLEDALRDCQDLPAKTEAEITVAHRNALRLLRLVNTLLDYSRAEAGRVKALFQKTDLPTLTRELASNFQSACERAGLSLNVVCEQLSYPVYVDRDMWEKIVLNLISNAFKFTLSGRIDVSLKDLGDQIELSVSDTGVGIPENELNHIFERFHRVEGQRGRTHEGSGIGLALVRELVHLHHGDIKVESNAGVGTTFRVILPFGEPHQVEKVDVGSDAHSTRAKAAPFIEEALRWLPAEGPRTRPLEIVRENSVPATPKNALVDDRDHVLVADDNADMRDYLRKLLAPYYNVETVENGAEAMQAVRRKRPDLLLSDVMMPVRDGFELLREIRSDAELSDLPIILLSARAGDEANIEGLSAGADDYLIKPFSAQELLARVNTNISMARLRRDVTTELETQKARLQAVLDTVPVAVWFTFDDQGKYVVGNRTASRMLRIPESINVSLSRSPPEIPQHFKVYRNRELLPPDQLPLRRAVRGETVTNEELELQFIDGTTTTGVVQAAPLRDRSGKIVGAVSAGLDITDRKRTEEHRLLLVNELNHRVKNTLVIVQSIAAQSFRGAANDTDGRESFEARLMALSRAHDVLTNENWEGANLEDIVAQAIAPYRGSRPNRFHVNGPHIRLSSKIALSMGMALHELATNAAKYGALSDDNGQISITWQTSDAGRDLSFEWREEKGPPVKRPRRRGFGTRLIEQGLAQELNGETKIEYQPSGVRCEIKARLQA